MSKSHFQLLYNLINNNIFSNKQIKSEKKLLKYSKYLSVKTIQTQNLTDVQYLFQIARISTITLIMFSIYHSDFQINRQMSIFFLLSHLIIKNRVYYQIISKSIKQLLQQIEKTNQVSNPADQQISSKKQLIANLLLNLKFFRPKKWYLFKKEVKPKYIANQLQVFAAMKSIIKQQ
ncbi:hypothetical protein ABPG74_016390 [Tetrahymena malaccensis]